MHACTRCLQIRAAIAELEAAWGKGVSAEWMIVYVRPYELDYADKNAKKVRARVRGCVWVHVGAQLGSSRRWNVRGTVPMPQAQLCAWAAWRPEAAARVPSRPLQPWPWPISWLQGQDEPADLHGV